MSDRTEEIRARVEKAHEMVVALCKRRDEPGKREWLMSIPARPDYDPDLVIGASLRDIPALLTELQALRQENARLKGLQEAAYGVLPYMKDGYFTPEALYARETLVDALAALSSSPAQEQKK